jgi:uncharacterized tellurite resistance protein B-like protein
MTQWFDNLKRIVNRHEPTTDPHALPRAAAALLLEMGLTDEGGGRAELEAVHRAMRSAFGIAEEELEALLEQAHQARQASVSLYDFTRELRLGLGPERCAELVEWLWEVALADASLGKYEEAMVRQVADLLGVPHAEFIRRKLRVKARVDGGQG